MPHRSARCRTGAVSCATTATPADISSTASPIVHLGLGTATRLAEPDDHLAVRTGPEAGADRPGGPDPGRRPRPRNRRPLCTKIGALMDETLSYDVVIIGGAVAGASTAILLKRRIPGVRVLVVEKSDAFRLEGRRVHRRGVLVLPDAGPQAVRLPLPRAAPEAGVPLLVLQRGRVLHQGSLGGRSHAARARALLPARPREARRAPAQGRGERGQPRCGGRRG